MVQVSKKIRFQEENGHPSNRFQKDLRFEVQYWRNAWRESETDEINFEKPKTGSFFKVLENNERFLLRLPIWLEHLIKIKWLVRSFKRIQEK